jgi:hypothetical protein
MRRYRVMAEKRNEGLLVRAHPLEQAERTSRSVVEVQLVDGALLLDADPAWAGAINTVLVEQGVRVSELCRPQKDLILARFQENSGFPFDLFASYSRSSSIGRSLYLRWWWEMSSSR